MESTPTAQQFYTALAGDPVRAALWRKLAAKLYALEVNTLANGETPSASHTEMIDTACAIQQAEPIT